MLATGTPRKIESRLKNVGGETLFLEYTIVPERDLGGRIVGAISIGHDITERKREDDQRLANLRFIQGIDQVNRAIQGTNDLEQMMRDVLDAVLSLLDCDRSWLLYPCDPEASHYQVPMERTKPEYPGACAANDLVPMYPTDYMVLKVTQEANGPVAWCLGGDQPPPGGESQDTYGVKSQITMLLCPKIGKPWMFGVHQCSYARVWTAEDKRLLQAVGNRLEDALTGLLSYRDLRKSEEFLNSIVENMPNMVFVKDAETLACLRLNKVGEQVLGYTREEVVGKDNYALFPKAEADFFTAKDREVLDGNTLVDIPEEILKRKDGVERVFHTKKIPICDEAGKPQYLLGISEDITARKDAERKIEHSLREKEILLRELYHRTKNNMNVICSMINIQSGCSDSEDVKAVLKDVDVRIRSMALVHQKLYQASDLSQIQLREYVEDLAQLLLESYKISSSNIGLEMDADPIPVLIDVAIPCGLVLNELMSNALKYAFNGVSDGLISISMKQELGDIIEIKFSDNGVGVSAGFDFRQQNTMGLQSIHALVEYQLRGTVEFHGGCGVNCCIRFKNQLYTRRV